MFYKKNLQNWKRSIRVIAGLAMVGCGTLGLPGLALGYLVSAAGIFTALTGFIGYCPVCSISDRKVKNNINKSE
jgi:hypothetical protein